MLSVAHFKNKKYQKFTGLLSANKEIVSKKGIQREKLKEIKYINCPYNIVCFLFFTSNLRHFSRQPLLFYLKVSIIRSITPNREPTK